MKISDILRHKTEQAGGVRPRVITAGPDTAVTALLATLAAHGIGAVIVRDEHGTICGIVSERDIARAMHKHSHAVLDWPVSAIMTRSVVGCAPYDSVDEVAETMTERRIRHMPVIDADHLVGIVSIGDVVAGKIRQLEQDRAVLESYITRGST